MQSVVCLTIAMLALWAPATEATPLPKVPDIGHPLRPQPGDDALKPIEPIRERAAGTPDNLDALAWFGVGELREGRGQFREAMEAYRKAIALDPNQVAVYRRLVPLEFNLGENEEGIEHALKLVELAPDDANLMQQLAQVLIARGRVADAASLLEKALLVKTVGDRSPQFLALQRDLGVLYIVMGQQDKAASAFEKLWDGLQNPDKYNLQDRQLRALLANPEATYRQLGETFLAAKKFDLATSAFEALAQARDGKSAGIEFDLARIQFAADNPQQALDHLNRYIEQKQTTDGVAVYALLKNVLEKLERGDEFIPTLEKIAKEQPQNSAVKIALAEELAEQEKWAEATKLYEEALRSEQEPTALIGLARATRALGEPEKLLDFLARATVAGATDEMIVAELEAIAEDKDLTEQVLQAERANLEKSPSAANFASGLLAGKLAVASERLDDARYFFNVAVRIRPDRKDTLYSELGIALLRAEEWEDAITHFEQALEATSQDAQRLEILFRLAQAREFHGETEKALEAIEEALKIAPELPLLLFQRAWIHFHAKQFDEAETQFLYVIEKHPTDADIVRQSRMALSALYVQKGDSERGQKVLEAVYAEDPDDVAVCNDLGYLYADQGKNLEQAEEMIRKAVDAEPENPAYLDSLGWVLYRQERYEEAVGPLEKAVKQPGGDDATLWDHLGDVYDKLNRPEDARKAWERALELARKGDASESGTLEKLEKKLGRP